MNKRVLIASKHFRPESENTFLLEYVLLEQETIAENGFGVCAYGVEIIKTTDTYTTSERVPSISYDKLAATKFIRLLVKHTVTPVTLRDVVHDWLYKKESPIMPANTEANEHRMLVG